MPRPKRPIMMNNLKKSVGKIASAIVAAGTLALGTKHVAEKMAERQRLSGIVVIQPTLVELASRDRTLRHLENPTQQHYLEKLWKITQEVFGKKEVTFGELKRVVTAIQENKGRLVDLKNQIKNLYHQLELLEGGRKEKGRIELIKRELARLERIERAVNLWAAYLDELLRQGKLTPAEVNILKRAGLYFLPE
jgi:hypothetical protein